LISTDKVEAEIPSSSEGVLLDIIAKEGETLTVGSILGHIESSSQTSVRQDDKSTKVKKLNESKSKKLNSTLFTTHKDEAITEKKPICEVTKPYMQSAPRNENVFLLIKNIVNKYGINLQKLIHTKNTLKDKKIYKSNILTLIKSKNIPTIRKDDHTLSKKRYTINPISRFRSVIMKNMLQSRKTSAHVSTFFKVNYSNIQSYKKNSKFKTKKVH
jgi:pyruvate/2-oxoglutarate dehydrogenase complex dihydrolipoamide acyltransferase (E2) component